MSTLGPTLCGCQRRSLQIGVEFRDAYYVLSAKSGRRLRSGIVFNVMLGFAGFEESGKR